VTDGLPDLESELSLVVREVQQLAAMVIESTATATAVLRRLDLDEARAVIERDDEVDALALSLEDRCTRLLTLQAPVARDLRSTVAALWIVADFERCGDLAVNLAKAARRLLHTPLSDRLARLLDRMGTEAVGLLQVASTAYATRDASMAAALPDLDDVLDRLHREWLEAIFEAHRDGCLGVEAGVQLALVGRYYERLGDHAVNVGNRIVYLATGWLPEHTGAARRDARNRLRGSDGADRGEHGAQWHREPPTDEQG
jgi:phosphate transport system protein